MKNLYTIKNCLNENLILLMYLKSYNYDNDKACSYLKIVLGMVQETFYHLPVGKFVLPLGKTILPAGRSFYRPVM